MEHTFELKVFELLPDGRLGKYLGVKSWVGQDGWNAVERFEDNRRVAGVPVRVIGWRPIVHGLFIGAPGPGSD